jgi:hypothetical protein
VCDVVEVNVVLLLLLLLLLLVLLVVVLLNPGETDKVDGREPNASLIEEFDDLWNECQSHRLLRVENATNLRTNAIPQTLLAEFVIFGNGTKLHQTTIGLRPMGRDEFVGGRPVDKLGTATTGTRETGIVKVGLDLGHIMGRDLHRGGVVVRAETVFVVAGARGAALVSPGQGYAFLVECLRHDISL